MEEAFVYRHQKKMRRGYTTAAAASGAAASMLFSGQKISIVSIQTPKGIRLSLEVEEITSGPGWVSCAVRKDGGDDIDATSGAWIAASLDVSLLRRPFGVYLLLSGVSLLWPGKGKKA